MWGMPSVAVLFSSGAVHEIDEVYRGDTGFTKRHMIVLRIYGSLKKVLFFTKRDSRSPDGSDQPRWSAHVPLYSQVTVPDHVEQHHHTYRRHLAGIDQTPSHLAAAVQAVGRPPFLDTFFAVEENQPDLKTLS